MRTQTKLFFCLIVLTLAVNSSVSFAKLSVAVTVDDLPFTGDLPMGYSRVAIAKQMIEIFKKHKVPEVYGFINAGKLKKNPETEEVFKIWKAAGFKFGNHAYQHEDLNKISAPDFQIAIEKNESALKKYGTQSDWKYFRFPFLHEGESLEKRNAIRAYLKKHDYQIAQVTVDFEDWSWNSPYARCVAKKDDKAISTLKETYLMNANDALDRADKMALGLFKRQIPQVLLLHIGAFDALVLDQLLSNYKAKGVNFISLSEATKDDIYQIDPKVVGPWGMEFTYQVMKSKGLKIADLGLEKYQGYPEELLQTICN